MLKSANLFTKNTVNRYENSDNFNSLLIYLIIKINSIFFSEVVNHVGLLTG